MASELAFPKPQRKSRKCKTVAKRNARAKARKASDAACDRLWKLIVKREGKCIFEGKTYDIRHPEKLHKCAGPLQGMHGISRRYKATKFCTWNGFPGCAGIHMFFTKRPDEWNVWLMCRWGTTLYESNWKHALLGETLGGYKPDYEQILAGLKEQAEALGVA